MHSRPTTRFTTRRDLHYTYTKRDCVPSLKCPHTYTHISHTRAPSQHYATACVRTIAAPKRVECLRCGAFYSLLHSVCKCAKSCSQTVGTIGLSCVCVCLCVDVPLVQVEKSVGMLVGWRFFCRACVVSLCAGCSLLATRHAVLVFGLLRCALNCRPRAWGLLQPN